MKKYPIFIALALMAGCQSPEVSNNTTTTVKSDSAGSSSPEVAENTVNSYISANPIHESGVVIDTAVLSRFWTDCVMPVINLDEQKLKKVVHFPLDGDWGYMIGLKSPGLSLTEDDFFSNLDQLFTIEFRDSLKQQSFIDVAAYQRSNSEVNLVVSVSFEKMIDGEKFETSRILRYKKFEGKWKLFLIYEAG